MFEKIRGKIINDIMDAYKVVYIEWPKSAQQCVQLTAFGCGGLALLAGLVIGWLSCLAFIGGN